MAAGLRYFSETASRHNPPNMMRATAATTTAPTPMTRRRAAARSKSRRLAFGRGHMSQTIPPAVPSATTAIHA